MKSALGALRKGPSIPLEILVADDDDTAERAIFLIHLPEAVIDHSHALGLLSSIGQHNNYGRGAYTHHRIKPNPWSLWRGVNAPLGNDYVVAVLLDPPVVLLHE